MRKSQILPSSHSCARENAWKCAFPRMVCAFCAFSRMSQNLMFWWFQCPRYFIFFEISPMCLKSKNKSRNFVFDSCYTKKVIFELCAFAHFCAFLRFGHIGNWKVDQHAKYEHIHANPRKYIVIPWYSSFWWSLHRNPTHSPFSGHFAKMRLNQHDLRFFAHFALFCAFCAFLRKMRISQKKRGMSSGYIRSRARKCRYLVVR